MARPIRRKSEEQNGPRFGVAMQVALATVWLAVYLGFFFSFELPNSNPRSSRMDVWKELPALLLDPIDPPAADRLARGEVVFRANSGWRYFPQRLDLIFVVGVILAGAWGVGHLVVRLVRPPLPARRLERTVFAFGVGLSALSLITLGCGLIGWLSRPLLAGIIVVSVATESLIRWQTRRTLAVSPLPNEQTASFPALWICAAALIPFLLATLFGSLLPSTDFDVNEYHFQGPKEFYQNGRIEFLPHNVYTSFPFGTEMLTLLAMVLRQDWYRGALAGKGVLMCFAPLTGLALFAAGRRWFSPAAGLFAAFIYLSTPWVYRISTIAYAEGGLCFYLFATLFAVELGIEEARLFEKAGLLNARRQFLLAGLLAGSAMACKYPAVLSVVIPMAAVIGLSSRMKIPNSDDDHHAVQENPSPTPHIATTAFQSRRPAWLSLFAFTAGVTITIGPWLLKNAVETGNPVYPLLYRVFGGRDWDDDLNAKWKPAHSPDNYSPRDLAVKLIDVTAKSDWLSPLLFGLAPLALVRRETRRRATWLWGYVAFLFLSWWLFTHRIDRFWVPLIPVVALLAGGGTTAFPAANLSSPLEGNGRSAAFVWRLVCGFCLVAVTLFNLGFITTSLCGFNGYLLDLGFARRIAAQNVSTEIAGLNEHLPPGSKVLFVGEAAVFEAEFPLVYNTVFDRSIFQEWCVDEQTGVPASQWKLRDATAIRRTLTEAGITHVGVNWGEIVRYRTTYGYTDFVTPSRFEELQRLGILGSPSPLLTASRDLASLPANWHREVETWGTALINTSGGRSSVITFQVFPILVK